MTVKQLCQAVSMSRQNFYKARRSRQRKSVAADVVCELVVNERKVQPRLGGRKLLKVLRAELASLDIEIGRDRFFKELANKGLLVDPLPKAPMTTMSAHSLPIFPNLIQDLEITAPNQVWVCDITYLRLRDRFVYLALITDVYSRKIVGYHLAETLKAVDALQALRSALKTAPDGCRPIHHSDRGCQYCSHEYVEELQKHNIRISMTEVNHCAENALAERMNGILKQEYGLRNEYVTFNDAQRSVDQSVMLYNTRRPHGSLNMEMPETVYREAA